MKRLGFVFLVLLSACAKPQAAGVQPYYGKTDTLYELLERVNANTAKVPTLWAKGDYDASIVDGGHQTDVSGDALLMYGKPRNLFFVGWAGPMGQVFRMGSGPANYWLTVKGDTDSTWFGTFDNIDNADLRAIPVRPDLVEAVLGLDQFDRDLSQQPCPTMRFNNDQRAYMVVWNIKYPDRWLAQKEVWYDLETRLPRLVNLFDANGRVVLSAYLSDHQPVKIVDSATSQPADAPMVATRYRLFFPETGSSLRLHFADLRLQSEGHPNAQNFTFNPQKAGTKHLIDLDEPPK